MTHEVHTQAYWDERYRSADRIWSGNVNPRLAEAITELTPGTALDIGCGEGGDAIHLAAHGWQVTGVDVSQVALDRAARAAGDHRITWERRDYLTWAPPVDAYDLVTAHFIQLPPDQRTALHRRLAAAVRPGGTLLIVGHHPQDSHHVDRPEHLRDLMFTAEDAASALDPTAWTITTSAVDRDAIHNGEHMHLQDAVLRATKR